MLTIAAITEALAAYAAPDLQEAYDNTGLLTGHPHTPCHAALTTLDVTTDVLKEGYNRFQIIKGSRLKLPYINT